MVGFKNTKTVYRLLLVLGLSVAIYDSSFYVNISENIPRSFFILLTVFLTVWVGLSNFDKIPKPIDITVYIGSLIGVCMLTYKYLVFHIGPDLSNIIWVFVAVSSILVGLVVWFFIQVISIGIYSSITQKDPAFMQNRDIDDPYNDPHASEILDNE